MAVRSRMPFAGPSVGAAVAVGAAVVLGGCQSEETPPTRSPTLSGTVSSASPSASGTGRPSPTETSDVPAAAREKTEKGAEAFVSYFFDSFNRAWTTPSPGLIASLSHSDCEFCATTEKAAAGLSAAGQHYVDDPVTLLKLERLTGAPADEVYFFADLRQNRSDIIDEKGVVVASDAKRALPSNVAVRWSGGGWKMYAVEETP